jgi:threonine synthase
LREGPFVEGLRCRECARTYPAEALHVCEWCFGPLEVVYDYEAIAATTSRERIAAGPMPTFCLLVRKVRSTSVPV